MSSSSEWSFPFVSSPNKKALSPAIVNGRFKTRAEMINNGKLNRTCSSRNIGSFNDAFPSSPPLPPPSPPKVGSVGGEERKDLWRVV